MCGSIKCQNHLHCFNENQCLSQSALPESSDLFPVHLRTGAGASSLSVPLSASEAAAQFISLLEFTIPNFYLVIVLSHHNKYFSTTFCFGGRFRVFPFFASPDVPLPPPPRSSLSSSSMRQKNHTYVNFFNCYIVLDKPELVHRALTRNFFRRLASKCCDITSEKLIESSDLEFTFHALFSSPVTATFW